MSSEPTTTLIARLEQISREHPQRVLRLRGTLNDGADPATGEAFELLIYRGFSSSTTHPTAFDPDQPVLAEAVSALGAELLAGPLNPAAPVVVAGPCEPEVFLDPEAW